MKKVISVISSLILAASMLTACGSAAASAPTAATVAEAAAPAQTASDSYTVAIVQQLDHSSLDEIRTAVAAELQAKASEAGIQIEIQEFNGQNDNSVLGQIGAQVVGDGVDMIIPIATLAAQAMVTAADGTDTPIVYAAISDPESAGLTGLDRVTGTSDALNTPSFWT